MTRQEFRTMARAPAIRIYDFIEQLVVKGIPLRLIEALDAKSVVTITRDCCWKGCHYLVVRRFDKRSVLRTVKWFHSRKKGT